MNLFFNRTMVLGFGIFAVLSIGCAETGGQSTEGDDDEEVGSAAGAVQAPSLLAATFGADSINGLFGCAGTVVDGLPVVFSERVDVSTVSPSDFTVTNFQGTSAPVLCATFAPSINADERRTVLLQGDFGNTTGQDPQLVQITGSILTESGGGDFLGASASVVPFSVGQHLVYARSQPLSGNIGGPDQCPATALNGSPITQIVQLAFGSNGGTNFPNTPGYRSRFHVMLENGTEVSPLAFGDVTVDNYLELCLGSSTAATSVRIDAVTVQDASGQPNQVEISAALEAP